MTTGTGMGSCGNLTRCGSACVDLGTDPLNCGSCAHICGGQDEACAEGTCSAPGPYTSVTAISVGSGGVYWATNGAEIHYRPTDWSTFQLSLPVANSGAGLAATPDGTSVFFTQKAGPGEIGLYQWTPSPVAALSLVESVENIGGSLVDVGAVYVSADGKRVVWAGQTADTQWHAYTTTLGPTNTADNTVQSAPGFSGDASYVYWSYAASQFVREDATGGTGAMTFTVANKAAYLAADDTASTMGYLYWLPMAGHLNRILKDPAASPQTVVPSAVTVVKAGGLVVVNSTVYSLDSGTSCAAATGSLTTGYTTALQVAGAVNLACPQNLAVGGGYFYYSAGATDKVQVVRLPTAS
jgi:hypothetical protein